MINLLSQYPGKVGAATGDYPYGEPRNITTPGDGTGTPWESGVVKDWSGFDAALVGESGITPSGSSDTANASDRLDAIFAILKSIRNPFANYAHFRDEKTSGTDGGTFSSGAQQTRALADYGSVTGDPSINNIVGVSIAANQITIPSGTYRVRARAPGTDVNSHQALLYDVTNSAEIIVGSSAHNTNNATDQIQTDSFVSGQFTAATSIVIELRHECQVTQSSTGFGIAAGFGLAEVYAELELWKLD